MAAFAKLIGLSVESNTEAHDYTARSSMIKTSRKTALERKDASWLQKKWRYFDNTYVKKIFGGDLNKKFKNSRSSSKVNESKDLPQFGANNDDDTGSNRMTQMEEFAALARHNSGQVEEEKYNPNERM